MQRAKLRSIVVSFVFVWTALGGGLGCSRDKGSAELTSETVQAVVAADAGVSDSGGGAARSDAGPIVPGACVVAVQALQISARAAVRDCQIFCVNCVQPAGKRSANKS